MKDPKGNIGPNSPTRRADTCTLIFTHFVQLVLIRARPPSFAHVELLACTHRKPTFGGYPRPTANLSPQNS
jgi:hypothetical protein